MRELIDWYYRQEANDEHPIVIAAVFHYRFVRIHPFDDGNGRIARLLMNRILLRHGYPLAIIRSDTRDRYLRELERADQTEDPAEFIDYMASCCEYPLNLYLRAARGEPIDDTDNIDPEIALFRQALGDGTRYPSRGPAASRGHRGVAVSDGPTAAEKFRALTHEVCFSRGPADSLSRRVLGTERQRAALSPLSASPMPGRVPETASEVAIEFGFSAVDFQNID